ncbi:poly-beta-1,6-N-acetyl-D-glucosamine biosynthesis protein PgaD [Acinetobacter sp. ANC 4648]|uniref:poly-beta-1,6-N-acetyl-D-glucosamine biosynthesis protein PgaD n=1 Tax=Acinetobacter sp. ANC 4648 TaxID=1977875 RepID=UPI000A350259|nr:poly-beta-1,6-N-acetyl-D-glucosamine biosynthesis protein PgaD [Acinetobacter sp. ANC 4648]OTG83803.1 poly-beta-1,6-N-acetyl-D-glucosamine biosynthesis protein PgaD [Acinetobacter sp. ANC 4648]
MKPSNLIIDIRRQLPWHKRYMSNTSTAMLWAMWILLWRPLMLIVGVIGIQKPHLLDNLFYALGLGVQHGLTTLLACAVALLLWSRFVPSKMFKKTETKSLKDYVEYFDLPEQKIIQGRRQKVSTIYHDENGKITVIE